MKATIGYNGNGRSLILGVDWNLDLKVVRYRAQQRVSCLPKVFSPKKLQEIVDKGAEKRTQFSIGTLAPADPHAFEFGILPVDLSAILSMTPSAS